VFLDVHLLVVGDDDGRAGDTNFGVICELETKKSDGLGHGTLRVQIQLIALFR
jgi:hypothetical protein